jgi:nitroimidazol reductase NimA-like FMN-containing flavoprotein (pyridoxamine 5'-phosphate oxidase superfamily)
MEIDRNGLEVLARDECLRLLGKATIGRVGLSVDALPSVLPVNFCVVDERIYLRTAPGPKLSAALDGQVVAFEVDDFDAVYHTGWSVVVTGRAYEVTDDDELEMVRIAPAPWAPLSGTRVVGITTELVSGRRVLDARSA